MQLAIIVGHAAIANHAIPSITIFKILLNFFLLLSPMKIPAPACHTTGVCHPVTLLQSPYANPFDEKDG